MTREEHKKKCVEILEKFTDFTKDRRDEGYDLADIIYTIFTSLGENIFRNTNEEHFDLIVQEIKKISKAEPGVRKKFRY